MCRKFLGKITPTCIEVSVSSTYLQTMGEMTLSSPNVGSRGEGFVFRNGIGE
jgi:hypothetical protein